MRKISEGLHLVSKSYYKNLLSYFQDVDAEATIIFNNSEYITIFLPYNFKKIYIDYIKDSSKSNGLSLLIKQIDFDFISESILKIKMDTVINLDISISYKMYMQPEDLRKFNRIMDQVSKPYGSDYFLEDLVLELLSNYYYHDIDLEPTFIKHFGVFINDLEEFKYYLCKGMCCFFCDDDLEDKIVTFINSKIYLFDIYINNTLYKESRRSNSLGWVGFKYIDEIEEAFKKEICEDLTFEFSKELLDTYKSFFNSKTT